MNYERGCTSYHESDNFNSADRGERFFVAHNSRRLAHSPKDILIVRKLRIRRFRAASFDLLVVAPRNITLDDTQRAGGTIDGFEKRERKKKSSKRLRKNGIFVRSSFPVNQSISILFLFLLFPLPSIFFRGREIPTVIGGILFRVGFSLTGWHRHRADYSQLFRVPSIDLAINGGTVASKYPGDN